MTRLPLAVLLSASLLPLACRSSSGGGPYEIGKVADRVIALDKETFPAALADPANAFWLLKFFAPWYALLFFGRRLLSTTIKNLYLLCIPLSHPRP
jgi:hypothetical protein